VAPNTLGVGRIVTVIPDALRIEESWPAVNSTVIIDPGANAGVSHCATALDTKLDRAEAEADESELESAHAAPSRVKSAPLSVVTAPPRA
jgi:hypothetical protein